MNSVLDMDACIYNAQDARPMSRVLRPGCRVRALWKLHTRIGITSGLIIGTVKPVGVYPMSLMCIECGDHQPYGQS